VCDLSSLWATGVEARGGLLLLPRTPSLPPAAQARLPEEVEEKRIYVERACARRQRRVRGVRGGGG
jgi:hypothetical protein